MHAVSSAYRSRPAKRDGRELVGGDCDVGPARLDHDVLEARGREELFERRGADPLDLTVET